ncbi:MAG: AraC family transcriptional regulator [Thermotogae bacterium]|jgi:AraC-like DNA-binding protein|nr:AraC family transcriptional regulator [Thermotogota bacterium]
MDEFNFVREKLTERIFQLTEKQVVVNPFPDLTVSRHEEPTQPHSYMLPPGICLAVQGTKRVLLGEEYYVYDVEHFLLTSLDLPVTAQIIEASKEKPYLGITWEIDMNILSELIVEHKFSAKLGNMFSGMALGKVTFHLLDAFRRLLDLVNEPEHFLALSSIISREIIYRLLMSELGPRLIQIALSENSDVMKALNYLKAHFSESIDMKELSELVGMSVSSFYQHFKFLTGMTPLQYQKQLRLCEARRLIMTGNDVTTASLSVGYDSLSQFSREYKRFFRLLPSQDRVNLMQGERNL